MRYITSPLSNSLLHKLVTLTLSLSPLSIQPSGDASREKRLPAATRAAALMKGGYLGLADRIIGARYESLARRPCVHAHNRQSTQIPKLPTPRAS